MPKLKLRVTEGIRNEKDDAKYFRGLEDDMLTQWRVNTEKELKKCYAQHWPRSKQLEWAHAAMNTPREMKDALDRYQMILAEQARRKRTGFKRPKMGKTSRSKL